MNRYLLPLSFSFLCFVFVISFIFTGCGDSETNILPSYTPAPSSPSGPMPDVPLDILPETGEPKSLFSRGIDIILEGLKDGITSAIGENTTGRVLDILGNKIGFGVGRENEELAETLKEINEKMDMILDDLDLINNKLDTLSAQLTLEENDLKNYITNTALNQDISDIEAAFSTTDNTGFIYYVKVGEQIDPNVDPDSPDMITLKNNMKTDFIDKQDGPLQAKVQRIHDYMCPNVGILGGVLKDYADNVILKSNSQNVSEPNNVMESYLLLETYFSQILNYQTRACIMIMEIKNYKDPDGKLQYASAYLNGTYKPLLREEIIQYLQTVNYLVVNLCDYRDIDNYKNNCPDMYLTGLSHDSLYLMVLARARFFSAQLMTSLEDDFGLYGTIVTPYDYSPGTNTPVTSLTLNFTGPANFTSTVSAQNIPGRFPYTRWYKDDDSLIHCSPDNNWSYYDFSTFRNPNISGDYFDPSIPAGTYEVTLADNGQNSPWYHTKTDLGAVTVKYYDPNNPDPDSATLTPTETNTLKFGYFSARWNWGYNKISLSHMSDWEVPSKHDVYFNSSKKNLANPTFDALTGHFYFPKEGTDILPVNILDISGTAGNPSGVYSAAAYKMTFPLIVDAAPGDASAASAKIYYYNTANVSYNGGIMNLPSQKALSSAYCYYKLADTDKNKEETICEYFNKDDNYINQPSLIFEGVSDIDLYAGNKSELSIDAGVTCIDDELYSMAIFDGSVKTLWNMNIIYSNTYNIFQ